MKNIACSFIAIALVYAVQSAFGKDSQVIRTDSFEITIQAVKTGKSFLAYFGDGKSLCNPMGGFAGGMSSIFMATEDDGKTYSYFAGKAEANTNAILVQITIEAKNTSTNDEHVMIGDFTLDYGTATTFLAVGYGEYPFVKTGAIKEAVSKEQNTIQPNSTRTLTYIFAIPNNTREARVIFKGKQSALLRFENK